MEKAYGRASDNPLGLVSDFPIQSAASVLLSLWSRGPAAS